MNIIKYVVLSFCLAATGCTAVTSVNPYERGGSNRGLVYFLPTTRIPLAVVIDRSNDQLKVTAGEPIYIADERYPYQMISIFSSASAEVVDFKVNANGLLETANLKSEGRFDEAVVGAAKSAGIFFENSAKSDGGQQVYVTLIDVEELSAERNDEGGLDDSLNKKLKQLNNAIESALSSTLDQLEFAKSKDSAGSKFLKRAKETKLPRVRIKVEREFRDSLEQTQDKEARDDCAVGFCYRLPVSYVLTASFFDGTVKQVTFAVPNGSRTYAAAINRGLFSTWDTKATLSNGMLKSYMLTTEGSELEELVLLPAEIVGGLIEGITQKGSLFDAQSTRIENEITLLKKRDELKKTREEKLEAENSVSGRLFFELTAGLAPKRTGQPLIVGKGDEKDIIPSNPNRRVSPSNKGTGKAGGASARN